jgi:hypothetical protein
MEGSSSLETVMTIDISRLLKRIEEQEASLAGPMNQLRNRAEVMWKAGVSVGESWSGSSFGYHSDLHYGQFERPPFRSRFSVEWGCIKGIPSGWAPRTPDSVFFSRNSRFLDSVKRSALRIVSVAGSPTLLRHPN